jgi:lipopolysaccharide export system permease protein
MAYNTEIIAILSSGISFKRMMYPYFISALFIAILSFTLNLFIIPPANKHRQAFENVYFRKPFYNTEENIHLQLQPGEFVYIRHYNTFSKSAERFSLEKFDGNQLVSKLTSDRAVWDSTKNKWTVYNYIIRDMRENGETLTRGPMLDTTLLLTDFDLSSRDNVVQSMDYFELNEYIDRLKIRGSKAIQGAYIEKYTRFSMPFSTFILTLIGVSLSSRKVRGGIGLHIGIGIGLSFTYIFFMQFSTILVDTLGALLAVWVPNIIFTLIAIYLYRLAPK